MILIPVSLGELIDKITILKIKLNKIKDSGKLININNEYILLSKILIDNNFTEENEYFQKLLSLNLKFWDYHDWQRDRWKNSNDGYIDTLLYFKSKEEHLLNDTRAEIKKEINTLFKSNIVEEKSF